MLVRVERGGGEVGPEEKLVKQVVAGIKHTMLVSSSVDRNTLRKFSGK